MICMRPSAPTLERAVRLNASFSVSMTPSTSAGGTRRWYASRTATRAMESATTSDAVFFLSPKGKYLGGRQNDDIQAKVTVLAQNAEINVKQTATSTIEAVR